MVDTVFKGRNVRFMY